MLKIFHAQTGDERSRSVQSVVSELDASEEGNDTEYSQSVVSGGGPSEPSRPSSAIGNNISRPGSAMSVLSSSGLAPVGKLRTGPHLPDFLEMSTPAKMQDFKRPNYMSEDSWVSLGAHQTCDPVHMFLRVRDGVCLHTATEKSLNSLCLSLHPKLINHVVQLL